MSIDHLFFSRHFKLDDLLECSSSFKLSGQRNVPREPETITALSNLCEKVLDPVVDAFGQVRLTHGFCSPELQALIQRGISPRHDQHAGYELNTRGRRICARGGAACDFIVPSVSSRLVASWVLENTDFDRLYFYGRARPLHVSVGPDCTRSVVVMQEEVGSGRRIPRRMSAEKFIGLRDG